MGDAKRFLFVMWEGGGTVPPELAVARRLVARGHAVRVLADPTIEAEARAAGCAFSPWTTAPHRTSRDRAHDVIRDYTFSNPLKGMDHYLRAFLADPAPRWAADTLAEVEARPVDAMVVDFALPSALVVAEKLGLPSATLMPNIFMLPTPGLPPIGPGLMPARTFLGRARDALLIKMTNRLFDKALPAINALRRSYGLAERASVRDQFLGAREVFVQTSPLFDFTTPHLPPHVRYVGPELADPDWSAPWRSPFAAEDARPLVVVGLSSTFQDQVPTLRRIVEALSKLPVRGLVTLGVALSPSEVPGADNVLVVPSAPHAQVLPHASLLVTHCGHGTTIKGLAAGLPILCVPMGRDQNDTAARVVHHGAGIRIKRTASTARIARAVETLLREPSYRQGAARLAQAIRTGEGCTDVVASLERLAGSVRAAAA
jgi:MGT family glycosyltransferase